jgi:4-hydroxy-2-oxoheptanedioate aldolase
MKGVMRPSRVLEKLRAGEIVSCFKNNTDDPRVVEIAAINGFDCIWSDMEHIGMDWSRIQSQIYAAQAHGVDLMVRVPRGSYSDLVRPLELNAAGIMVPHVMGLRDAQEIVRQTKFYPIGKRAVDAGNTDGAYCSIEFKEYLELTNRNRFTMVQVEDEEPLSELEDIVKLDGIDIIFFGPGDFSQSIGHPGEWNHPTLVDTRKRIAEVTREYGKYAGTVCVGDADTIEEFIDMGYRFLSIGADVLALNDYCTHRLCAFNDGVSAYKVKNDTMPSREELKSYLESFGD